MKIPKPNPWRYGYCDGLFDRESISPWRGMGWKYHKPNQDYLRGYMAGKEARKKLKEAA